VLWKAKTTVCRIFGWKLPASSRQLPAERWELIAGNWQLFFDIVWDDRRSRAAYARD